jgi:hypothetical protein
MLAQSGFARQHPIFQAMERAGTTRVPPLYGYVGTSQKETAQPILETHLGDPLLAVWEYGLGRTAAWTSDATGRWGIDWVDWSGFPNFWSNLVRWTAGDDGGGRLETEVRFSDEEAVLTVEARGDGEELLNDLMLEATVVGPAGVVENISLRQVGPGRYEVAFFPSVEGAYLIRVTDQAGVQEQTDSQTIGWVLGYSPEYSQLTGDERLLTTISQITGGRDLSAQFEQGDFDAVLAHDLPVGQASRPIWPWLLLIAVLLLPLDIALRRIALTRSDADRLWQATAGRFWRSAKSQKPPSEQVARLFRAKERAARRPTSEPAHGLPLEAIPDQNPMAPEDAPDNVGAVSQPDKPVESPDDSADESQASLAARLLQRRQRGNSDGD